MAKRSPSGVTGSDVSDRATQDWVTGHLRRIRTETAREVIPERMRQLLDQLDRLEKSEEEDPP